MFQKLPSKAGLQKLKLAHLIMLHQKFGRIKHTISDQTFGLLAVYCMKWSLSTLLSQRLQCNSCVNEYLKVRTLQYQKITQRILQQLLQLYFKSILKIDLAVIKFYTCHLLKNIWLMNRQEKFQWIYSTQSKSPEVTFDNWMVNFQRKIMTIQQKRLKKSWRMTKI